MVIISVRIIDEPWFSELSGRSHVGERYSLT